jgi:DtxR family Mn-dependent transcriptional regulator
MTHRIGSTTATMDAMADASLESLTLVAQDYLKVIWSATEWGQDPITATGLAARFGTSVANVTVTVKRLAAQGLVEYIPYKPVRLTPAGTVFAIAMVRRHRLLETFLVEALGYGWAEVHDEAERLEHAVSDSLIERIDTVLGHPRADPHGDPIPAAGTVAAVGAPTHTGQVHRLDDTSDGTHRVLRVSDADAGVLDLAAGIGLRPGAWVRIRHTPSGVTANGTNVPGEVAAAVWVD